MTGQQAELAPADDGSHLLTAISEELGLPVVPEPSATLAELGVDSLGLFQLVCLVEERAGGGPAEELPDYPVFESVADVLAYYHELRQQGSGGTPGLRA